MRCPKCGFISFDHMDTCLKCKKDITKGSDVKGTTYHAVAPSFLRVPDVSRSEEKFETESEVVEEEGLSFSTDDDESVEEFDFSDPDLEVLVEEGDESGEDDEGGSISFDDQAFGDGLQLDSDDEKEEEGGFDLEFEGGEDLGFSEEDNESAPASFDASGELGEITDLAPPAETNDPIASLSNGLDLSLDDDMSLDEDLHLDGLDLDLGLSNNEDASDTELSLSLDDIDLSSEDILGESNELDDLSLNLDLDDLNIAPAKKEDKAPGSLDGISLSLD